MAWRALVLEVDAAAADALGDALLAHGAAAASVEDALAGTAAEQPVFDEPGSVAAAAWKRARLRALVAADVDPAPLLAAAARDAGIRSSPPFVIEDVGDTDWVSASQDQFAPIRVSTRLWIVPSWHDAPDPAALNLRLDPGLAFGTGSHPTTRLCLRWLEARVRPGATVLDYGCGSGILAIAALLLGARAATGVDVDPAALEAARANAARNAVPARFVGTDVPRTAGADLVVANILANPLIVLAPALAAHCRPGGRIALSGILAPQAAAVTRAYAEWCALAPFGEEDGWVCLEGVRR